jgi:hypothetical protein
MENSHSPGLFVRHGAVWLTMLGMAVGGIWWAAGLAGKVENQQIQIIALQAAFSERGKVVNQVEGMQRDVTRLENRQEQIREELDERSEYEQVIARQGAHIEALDMRMGRMDERLLQVERAFGRQGLGHNDPR